MKEMNIDSAPLTFSEYFEAARKFKKDVDGDGYVDRWISYRNVEVTWWQRLFDFYTLYLAISGGGSLVKDNEVAFENEYAVQTFAFFRKLYENDYYTKERLEARQDAFLSGIIATRFTGPWDIARAEKFKPEGFEYAYSPIPVPDDHEGPVYTYGDPKNIVFFNTCSNPLIAWEFLKFLINKENDRRLLEISHQLPRRKNLFEDPFFESYFGANPKMIPFAKQAKYVKGTDACPVMKEVFDIISQEYEACVIYGIKTPEKAIKDAAQAARLLLM
jgi:multiple sugar transport system substrate-binding protein